MEEKVHYEGINKQLTWLIVITQSILVIWSVASSILESGPISASIITYTLFAVYVVYALVTKNRIMTRLVLFGAVAGILELFADHYLVDTIDSLVYPGNEAMIWSSPAYMPLAWANVLIQLSYYGILLSRWKGLTVSTIVLAISGGMYIPLYEHLAKDAGWWWYNNNTAMVFNAPVYVIVCEALISLSLPLLIYYSVRKKYVSTLVLAIFEGIWIYASAVISYLIAH